MIPLILKIITHQNITGIPVRITGKINFDVKVTRRIRALIERADVHIERVTLQHIAAGVQNKPVFIGEINALQHKIRHGQLTEHNQIVDIDPIIPVCSALGITKLDFNPGRHNNGSGLPIL